jgi:chromosome segregation ATPase
MAGRLTKNSLKSSNRQSANFSRRSNGNNQIAPPKKTTTSSISMSITAEQFENLSKKVDKLLESQNKLLKTVDDLQQVIVQLEGNNKSLQEANKLLESENTLLSDKLKNTETALSTTSDHFETLHQKYLCNTVEILDVTGDVSDHLMQFVEQYGQIINCNIKEEDISNIYCKTHRVRNLTKTKIVLQFVSLRKRMQFYYSSRTFRFNKKANDRDAGHRFIKVVDALTQYKKAIFLEIISQRRKHADIVKNVFVNNGEIFIRRFGINTAEPVKNMEFVETLFHEAEAAATAAAATAAADNVAV